MATKMTREEALNKVRQMSLPKETMEILEALAPELAESELQRQCVTWFRLQYPTEVFTSEWEGVVLIRDGKVYGYND